MGKPLVCRVDWLYGKAIVNLCPSPSRQTGVDDAILSWMVNVAHAAMKLWIQFHKGTTHLSDEFLVFLKQELQDKTNFT